MKILMCSDDSEAAPSITDMHAEEHIPRHARSRSSCAWLRDKFTAMFIDTAPKQRVEMPLLPLLPGIRREPGYCPAGAWNKASFRGLR